MFFDDDNAKRITYRGNTNKPESRAELLARTQVKIYITMLY